MFLKNPKVIFIYLLLLPLLTACGDTPPSSSAPTEPEVTEAPAVFSSEERFSDTLVIDLQDDSASAQFFSMDTVMSMTVYGSSAEAALRDVADMIDDKNTRLAAEDPDSELSLLNASGKAAVSFDLLEMLTAAQEYYEATDGAFNVALYPVKKAWGFADGNYRVPAAKELQELLSLADPLAAESLELPAFEWPNAEAETVSDTAAGTTLLQGIQYNLGDMELDFGGIAKGYTADEAFEILKQADGVTAALFNLGGNVLTVGNKPDGSDWRVGIQDPAGEKDYLGVLTIPSYSSSSGELLATAVVTSGGYERFFEEDDVRYHHILDPATAYPAESGLQSVTVISDDTTLADALSTALFVMGLEKATEFWKSGTYDFEMILLDDENVLHVTEGVADAFETEASVNVIHQYETNYSSS